MTTIVHISDLHFGRHDPVAVEALADDIAGVAPDVVVNSGDFTQRSRRGQWLLARDFMARLAWPRVCVPGNHDIPLFDVVRRFLSPLGRFRSFITPEAYPFWSNADVAIAGVCTARPFVLNPFGFWKDGSLSDQQLRRVAASFASCGPSVARIVVAHHPFVPPRNERARHHIVWRAREALTALAACELDIALSGHLHLSYCDESLSHHPGTGRSVLCIQSGTGVSRRRRAGHGNAYDRIEVRSREQVIVEVRIFDGRSFVVAETCDWRRLQGTWRRV